MNSPFQLLHLLALFGRYHATGHTYGWLQFDEVTTRHTAPISDFVCRVTSTPRYILHQFSLLDEVDSGFALERPIRSWMKFVLDGKTPSSLQ